MYAVVSTGGKQLKVAKDDVVVVEKLDVPVGETVTFDVLFAADGESFVVDPSEAAAATVTAEVLEHFKGEKAVIFKFKKRKGYKRLKGHRQQQTRVKITDVSLAAPKKAPKKPAKKAAAVAEPVEEPTAEAPAQDAE